MNLVGILSTLVAIFLSVSEVQTLKCFVGLGNNADRRKQKVVQCPEDKHYVCVKMYGADMGDQIRRKCEKMAIPDFEELLEKEALKERAQQTGESLEGDPACHNDVHHGRDVHVCFCSTDQCNSGSSLSVSQMMAVSVLSFWWMRHETRNE